LVKFSTILVEVQFMSGYDFPKSIGETKIIQNKKP